MNLARVVIKDLPWVTFELRTKKKKRKSFSGTEISKYKDSESKRKRQKKTWHIPGTDRKPVQLERNDH